MAMLTTTRYKLDNAVRAVQSWAIPYAGSVLHADQFRPVLGYLMTDWKCNVHCHYCFQSNNAGERTMSWETAKASVDWLKSTGCRVLALMGGEPLLRKEFVVRIFEYGAREGFFVYLPTNGYLMDREFIDAAGEAGVAAVNLATDVVAAKPGLPKALMHIEPQFRYLVERQTEHGYVVFLNINITAKNLRDVKLLTEIAHDNGIATDYHLNEMPHDITDVSHYSTGENDLWIKPEHYAEVEALLDWLIAKHGAGYTMVNSIGHLRALKKRLHGEMEPWKCRAGKNGVVIDTDGRLAPCFDLITHPRDWGTVGAPKLEREALDQVKAQCAPACSSTCFYNLADYYHPWKLAKWVAKHAMTG